MRITNQAVEQRVQDAGEHDEVFIMVGDPAGGDRPLLQLSVTKDGYAVIEYEPSDLAAGIRQLNKVISEALRAPHGGADGLRLIQPTDTEGPSK